MPATRDGKTWRCQFYYEDWQGNKKKKQKRGFKTKKEALEWERNYKLSANANMDMTMGAFIEIYFRDKAGELKERSAKNKRYMIEAHVLPYFENKPMNSITPSDIIQWQNEIRAKGFSQTYLRMIQNQITALFTHASNIYNLANNPCKRVKRMGKADADKLEFWTKEEYKKFSFEIMDKPVSFYAFEMLYWCGIREGELLALTSADFDFDKETVTINKSYQRLHGEDVITTPKTKKSNRTIKMPNFLCDEMKDYLGMLYGIKKKERIFTITKSYLHHEMDRGAKSAGVKRIRIHDLRHSHISLLIDMGFSAVAIADRVGHESIEITYRYAHLFPSKQTEMADKLDFERMGA